MPPELELFGLERTLESFFGRFNQQGETRFEFDCTEALPALPDQKALALYRIVQELVTNSIKHAGASLIRLEIKTEPQRLLMLYNDNGKGMDASNLQKQRGAGLKNIESRISLINGDANYKSAPGKGFECFVEVPLTAEMTKE
jgi:signal transduction histidine kinase